MAKPVKTLFKDAIEKDVKKSSEMECTYVSGDLDMPGGVVIGCKVSDEPQDLLNFVGE